MVEAALTIDPDNADLKKLKGDLQEVLDLTKDLIAQQVEAGTADGEAGVASSVPKWAVGDRCLAPFSEDEQYYEAHVDEILADGTCTVTFTDYGNQDVMQVALLKLCADGIKRYNEDGDGGPSKKMKKKDIQIQQREYKRKKNQKKAQRQQKMEEERESEKSKWVNFMGKAGKTKIKKSIFSSPESVSGRVGVGTCGSGGQPMTKYTNNQKWKK